jgi:hypothetical protein
MEPVKYRAFDVTAVRYPCCEGVVRQQIHPRRRRIGSMDDALLTILREAEELAATGVFAMRVFLASI